MSMARAVLVGIRQVSIRMVQVTDRRPRRVIQERLDLLGNQHLWLCRASVRGLLGPSIVVIWMT